MRLSKGERSWRHHGWSVVWLGQGGASGDGTTDVPQVDADENEGEGPKADERGAAIRRRMDRARS
jgi:hypothetical protein